jgi:hypothetical protein
MATIFTISFFAEKIFHGESDDGTSSGGACSLP